MGETTVAIIGGGMQGVCAAVALARQGARVTIFEAADALLDRASFRSEGKIHLGFVYANDPTGQTADLMLDAAMHFGPLLESWIGAIEWESLRSSPFTYVTLPDSQLPKQQLNDHYERIDQSYRENYRNDGLHYLGLTPDSLLGQKRNGTRPPASDGWLARGEVVAHTSEVALDRPKFRALMRAAVAAQSAIQIRLNHRVETVTRRGECFRIVTTDAGNGRRSADYTLVVNCSWTDRLRLDQQVGLKPDRPWVYRLKFRLLGNLVDASRHPSMTLALGPYGDFVTYSGNRVYISWYPVCMRGWSKELTPPESWEPACCSRTPKLDAAEVIAGTMEEFGAIIPALRTVEVDDVGAGVIFSWGTRDIDDPISELHRRSEIGVEGGNGYYTINTGKFTCAPLFAHQLLNRIHSDGALV